MWLFVLQWMIHRNSSESYDTVGSTQRELITAINTNKRNGTALVVPPFGAHTNQSSLQRHKFKRRHFDVFSHRCRRAVML